MNEEDFDMHAV